MIRFGALQDYVLIGLTVEASWVRNEAKGTAKIVLQKILRASNRRNNDYFTFLSQCVSAYN